MKNMTRLRLLALLALLSTLNLRLSTVSAQNTVVTYQGRVQSGGSDFNGSGQFKFALVTSSNANSQATATATVSGGFVTIYIVTFGGSGYVTAPTVTISGGGGSGATATASITGGVVTQITAATPGSGYTGVPTVTISAPPENLSYATYWSNDGTSGAGSEPAAAVSVPVSNGLFTVRLGDPALANMTALGAGLFTQSDLKLRIWFNDGVNGFAVLHPAQPLTAAPYALVAGTVSQLSGPYGNAVAFDNPANSFRGSGAGLTALDASQLSQGTVPAERLPGNLVRTNQVWLLGGNSGTRAGTHFLGTTDDEPLEFKVNGLRALRLENNGDSADFDTTPDGAPNVIGGSPWNFVSAGVVGATIGGGGATNYYSGGYTNSALSDFAVVGGGLHNNIGSSSTAATIAGGQYHSIGTDSEASVIGGGSMNDIEPNSISATIAGGQRNDIRNNSDKATIGGGENNTIVDNSHHSAIGGGAGNTIVGNAAYATIPGGVNNNATNYAFAAGSYARALHTGAFVWSDGAGTVTTSAAANSVTMRGRGGFRFLTGSGSGGAQLAAGDTSWSVLSDRNVKKDFAPVDSQAILEKLAALPITQWHYQWEEPGVTPHIGPMAQDFKAAFYPGSDDKRITTQEADGVALAAIQALNQKLDEQHAELKAKDARIAALEQAVAELKAALQHPAK
ncbi:MAG: tail fiber domain-containing protein [Verrucomicrobia bacterium]|nr:tail fiber domain-containing protein [Verrucomicrobiota bacterium]